MLNILQIKNLVLFEKINKQAKNARIRVFKVRIRIVEKTRIRIRNTATIRILFIHKKDFTSLQFSHFNDTMYGTGII